MRGETSLIICEAKPRHLDLFISIMRKTYKITNIAFIFTLIGVVLWQEVRIPCLISGLSSNDTEEIDKASALLDTLSNPEQIVRIIERALANRTEELRNAPTGILIRFVNNFP